MHLKVLVPVPSVPDFLRDRTLGTVGPLRSLRKVHMSLRVGTLLTKVPVGTKEYSLEGPDVLLGEALFLGKE